LLILELTLLLSKTRLGVLGITAIVGPMLDWDYIVMVLLGQDFSVMDRLHRGMVVVLVNFTVSRNLTLLALMRIYRLMLDARCHTFVNLTVVRSVLFKPHLRSHIGIMLSGLGDEAGNGCLGFLHFMLSLICVL
jgi:hypothetical protein